jgi:hypothetical protein
MVPSIMSFEIASLLRAVLEQGLPEPGREAAYLEMHEQLHKQARDRIEKKYLSNLDLNQPIQRITRDIAEMSFAKIWLIVRQPLFKHRAKSSLSSSLRDQVFRNAISLSESIHRFQTTYAAMNWDWMFRGSSSGQWHTIATILSNLLHRTDARDPDVQRAWAQVEVIFENHDKERDQGCKMREVTLWKPLVMLKGEAEIRRQEAEDLAHENARTGGLGGLREIGGSGAGDTPMEFAGPEFEEWEGDERLILDATPEFAGQGYEADFHDINTWGNLGNFGGQITGGSN